MRVWERGSGETLACGTGACASFAAAVTLGLSEREGEVQVPGGTIQICWPSPQDSLFMTGPAVTVFEGEWS